MANGSTEALIARGEYEEAARALEAEGQLAEAARLMAEVWRYDDAVRLALASSSPEAAYGYAAASRDARLVAETIEQLRASPDAARKAADTAEARERWADAASLLEASGELARAASLFETAGDARRAAALFERLGELRQAGILYERCVAEDPDDTESATALGRILLGFGRPEHAARALQRAALDPAQERAALPLLLRALVALELVDAAAEILDRLRRVDEQLPLDPRLAAKVLAERDASGGAAEGAEVSELLRGRYRVLRTLGAGGSGRVLAAEDVFAAREVAVKVLSVAGGGAQGRDALARFAREAQITASIEHPNVVRSYEYVPDGPMLVMELMAGGTLEERLAAGGRDVPLSPLVVAHVGRSILRALDAVHRRGVIHRDLKPANVFFGSAGEVKVGDFGVAHLSDARATRTGAMMGTLGYMAPEQITGDGNPDASTDLYAFGVIAYRMLVGALPYPGPDFLAQHLGAPIPSASEHAPWLDPAFDPWLERLLGKTREARFGSALEALDALERLPFALAEERFSRLGDAGAIAPSGAATRPSSAPGPRSSEDERYEPRGSFSRHGRDVVSAFDTLLERPVWLLRGADDALRAHLRPYAKALSPYLQTVLDVDDDAGLVVLDAPSGEPARATPVATDRMEHVAGALDALEARGLAHGSMAPSELVLGATRTVVLLPLAQADGSIDDDRRAVARLFGGR